jgi:ribosomal protein L37AE/L43A
MIPVTESRACPKCRADMFMLKSVSSSEKWKCTGCNAVFFFDPLEDELSQGQGIFPMLRKPILDYVR